MRKKRQSQVFNNPLAAQRAVNTLKAEGYHIEIDTTKKRGPKLTWW